MEDCIFIPTMFVTFAGKTTKGYSATTAPPMVACNVVLDITRRALPHNQGSGEAILKKCNFNQLFLISLDEVVGYVRLFPRFKPLNQHALRRFLSEDYERTYSYALLHGVKR